MRYIDQYKEIFNTIFDFQKEDIRSHIQKLKELDNLLPPSSTYLLITNTQTNQYEFISKNFELATGLKKKPFLEKGIPHYLSLIHPEEINTWIQILRELMEFYLSNFNPEMLDRIDFQYNYRFKVGEEKYINVLENQVNLLADQEGRPMVGMGHFIVIGDGDPLPMRASARILNDKNEYETIFHKEYGIKLLEDKITSRERDIIRLIALGHDNNDIADKLSISHHTVRTHRKNLLSKTNCKNSTELVVQCIRDGLI